MATYGIAEVARLTGIPATTLRYYEEQGVIPSPTRAANGYRTYTERDVSRLRFVGRARALDLVPAALRELVEAWDSDRCATVQHRLTAVVSDRLQQAQRDAAGLVAFTEELQQVGARLRGAPQDGPCDDQCGCATLAPSGSREPLPGGTPSVVLAGSPEIACTLTPDDRSDRGAEWRALLSLAISRSGIDGGVALTFPSTAETVSALATLAVAEQACCAFFDFRITFERATVQFEVRAAPDAQAMVATLFGRPDAS